jgi:hypothetical protein
MPASAVPLFSTNPLAISSFSYLSTNKYQGQVVESCNLYSKATIRVSSLLNREGTIEEVGTYISLMKPALEEDGPRDLRSWT